VTADAGKAAFEELKRLSTPLVEFVAADQGIPPEIVFRALLGLGNAVRLSAGQAAAVVLLNKPAQHVTKAEAREAVQGIADRGDDERRHRARRAALRETLFTLAPVVVPANLTGLVSKSIERLDEGNTRAGMFMPVKLSRGRPGHGVNDANERLMVEAVYTQTLKNVSRSEAVTIVTGVERSDAAPTNRRPPEPTMPRSNDHKTLCRIVADLEAALPKVANDARLAAEAQLRDEPAADFDAFRKHYLALERARVPRRGRRG
jgi:hypothetical protein